MILCTFYKLLSQKMLHLRIYLKKCRIYALLSKNEFWTWSQMGPKYQFGPKKVQILLTSPKFFRFPHFFSTFPGFLGFSQFFSVVFRFSKVLHKSSRLHRGTNMTRNSGLEKVPILLTSPKFLSFPRYTQLCILSMATLSDKLGQVSSEHRGFFEMPEISACPC